MKFEVDQKLVEPIIRDQIASAITAAIGDPEQLIRTMVSLALKQKVNGKGQVDQYASYNTHDFIEALAGNAIRDAARDAIIAMVNDQKPLIQAAIEAELKRAPKKTAASIVSAFCESAGHQYRVTANFQIVNAQP